MKTLHPLLLLVALCVAAGVSAQPSVPKRPKLSDTLDARDWRSYYSCGLTESRDDRAHACFYWAARLDPERPEPLYAEWMLNPKGRQSDSLRREALLRYPFFYHAHVIALEERRYGIFSSADARAWGGLSAGNYYGASTAFAQLVSAHPDDPDSRWGFAVALYHRRLYDSAAAQVHALADILRREQEKKVVLMYHSLDFVGYMEAIAWLEGGQRDSARAALERSLGENLAFYYARALLGDVALAAADSAAADAHWEQARELLGGDAYMRRRYAHFLQRRGRLADAERELRAVLAAEPHWVNAYWDLASVIDAQGESRRADALAAYTDFLARAPAVDSTHRGAAQKRVTELGAP